MSYFLIVLVNFGMGGGGMTYLKI